MLINPAAIQPESFKQKPLTFVYPVWQIQSPPEAIKLKSYLQLKQRLELKLKVEFT